MTDESKTNVRWIRAARTRNGAMPHALRVAGQIATLAKQSHGLHVQVFFDVAGEVGTIRWMADFPDLGAYERTLREVAASDAFKSILDDPKVAGLFIDGSSRDLLLLSA